MSTKHYPKRPYADRADYEKSDRELRELARAEPDDLERQRFVKIVRESLYWPNFSGDLRMALADTEGRLGDGDETCACYIYPDPARQTHKYISRMSYPGYGLDRGF